MTTILSTKKLTEKNKVKLENAGLLIVERNFIKTKKVTFSIDKINKNLIFTSKNAVKNVLSSKNKLIEKPVFCVGNKTKKFLEKKGFTVLEVAENANELAKIICNSYQESNFTFFCGNIRKNTLPDALQANKIKLNEIVVYKTVLKPYKISVNIDGILFFSPSGVESFLQKNEIKKNMCFCIGQTTANSLQNITTNIKIAKTTTVESVIKKCIKYYTK